MGLENECVFQRCTDKGQTDTVYKNMVEYDIIYSKTPPSAASLLYEPMAENLGIGCIHEFADSSWRGVITKWGEPA